MNAARRRPASWLQQASKHFTRLAAAHLRQRAATDWSQQRSTNGGSAGRRSSLRAALAVAAACACAGCATSVYRFADLHAMQREVVEGAGFRHLVLYRAGVPHDPLHVYLEHDGNPWVAGTVPAADPTPRNPLALRLMASDAASTLYLGRPCYFSIDSGTACTTATWTSHRYSKAVVDSLAAALARAMQQHGHVQAWLLGHSGGGTLAVLLAARMPPGTITRVVTVGANLDVAAWSSHHGYSPLSGSLDPAREPPLPANVEVVHFVGGRDVVVPPETLDGYRRQHPEARFEGMREYDHTCCWEEAWAALLQGLEAKPARALPPR